METLGLFRHLSCISRQWCIYGGVGSCPYGFLGVIFSVCYLLRHFMVAYQTNGWPSLPLPRLINPWNYLSECVDRSQHIIVYAVHWCDVKPHNYLRKANINTRPGDLITYAPARTKPCARPFYADARDQSKSMLVPSIGVYKTNCLHQCQETIQVPPSMSRWQELCVE